MATLEPSPSVNDDGLAVGEAIVEISESETGGKSVNFSFQTSEEFSKALEQRQLKRKRAAEKETKEKFQRRNSTEEETLERLQRLGSDWFSVAIGFLKVVPDLTDRNFLFVREEVAASVETVAESVARGKSTTLDEHGRSTYRYVVAMEDLPIILRKMGRSLETLHAANALARSSLGALISDYEAFISNLIRAIAGLKQGILISDTDTIQIGSLSNFSTFDELIDDLIDDKIQELLHRESHIQVLKWLESKFSINLTSDKEIIKEFAEICQRRNILIHAGGRVNKKYRRVCEDEGWRLEDIAEVGETLDVSRRYIRRATARVFLIGFFTLHIIWQKLLPKRKEDSLNQLLSVSHDFVDNGLTKMSRRICVFALANDRGMSARLKAYFTINLAQSFLFDPDIDDDHRVQEVERIVSSHDWSMAPPTVTLAIACLRRDFSNAEGQLSKAFADGLSYREVMTWSVFRELRTMDSVVEFLKSVKG